jgi:adenosylcobyric acid synthase
MMEWEPELESRSDTASKAPCISVLGTGSDVGKSIVVTALCRYFTMQGLRVAPYKAQNMSNNSGVTPEGLEMGRAQIVQAEACRVAPHVDMNPVLLKPTSQVGSQVVVLGEALANQTASEYHQKKEDLFATCCQALDRLRTAYDLIVMEGAGSCAEVNLMPHDLVNFRMAEYAEAPVILVGDIHRGGIFAQLVGTLACLSRSQQERIKGFIINRFKGDIRLFDNGVQWIEQKTRKPVFGVLPWYDHISIDAEDSVVIEKPVPVVAPCNPDQPEIAVLRLPHISNFTDFHPLSQIPGISVSFVENARELSVFSAVIIPGSKNTRFDLEWIKTTGWAEQIKAYAAQGGSLLGLCGGYQIMGNVVHDPEGLEGQPGSSEGLQLLPVETTLQAPKTTTSSRFRWHDITASGYEIHMGYTARQGGKPVFEVYQRNQVDCRDEDGCMTGKGRIMGSYMHGLFDTPAITRRWLETIGLPDIEVSALEGPAAKDREYDLLAEHFGTHMDMEKLEIALGAEEWSRL